MAKICPLSGEKVLYLDCLDCEDKLRCSSIVLDKKDEKKTGSFTDDFSTKDINRKKLVKHRKN